MTSNEREQLEGFGESFADGAMIKELRLSTEREIPTNRYPKARSENNFKLKYTDGKTWYEVKLSKE